MPFTWYGSTEEEEEEDNEKGDITWKELSRDYPILASSIAAANRASESMCQHVGEVADSWADYAGSATQYPSQDGATPFEIRIKREDEPANKMTTSIEVLQEEAKKTNEAIEGITEEVKKLVDRTAPQTRVARLAGLIVENMFSLVFTIVVMLFFAALGLSSLLGD